MALPCSCVLEVEGGRDVIWGRWRWWCVAEGRESSRGGEDEEKIDQVLLRESRAASTVRPHALYSYIPFRIFSLSMLP